MVPTDSDDRIPTRPDEQLLVVRCQLGEPEAFDALIDRWHGPLWVYIRRMTGRDDEAQDVLQDVWLRVVRGIARLRDAARLRAWLFGIARRVLMDRLRQKYAAPPIAEIEGCDVAAGPTPLDRDAELDALHAALERLPLVEREVLTLFYLRDLSLAELADALDVPVGTVKSRLFRARRLAGRGNESDVAGCRAHAVAPRRNRACGAPCAARAPPTADRSGPIAATGRRLRCRSLA